MSLKARIDRLERDSEAEGTWPCPECGWCGAMLVVRAVQGEDGVVRYYDTLTGVELSKQEFPTPCTRHRGMVSVIEIGDSPVRTD